MKNVEKPKSWKVKSQFDSPDGQASTCCSEQQPSTTSQANDDRRLRSTEVHHANAYIEMSRYSVSPQHDVTSVGSFYVCVAKASVILIYGTGVDSATATYNKYVDYKNSI